MPMLRRRRRSLVATTLGLGTVLSVTLYLELAGHLGQLVPGNWHAPAALALGLVLTVVAARTVNTNLGRANNVERLVSERTAELGAANEALTQARDDALEASQLKSQFLANMSHELRTPLNSIIGFSELLIDRVPGPLTEDQEGCVTDIHDSGRHLLELINDILDLSKIEAGKMELNIASIDLADVVRGTVASVQPQAQAKAIALRTTIPPGLPPTLADPAKTRQVLINLLSNAVKFTPSGGEVEVHVRLAFTTPAVTGGEAVERVVVEVTDTGVGIEPEHQDLIFEEFRQVDGSVTREHEGTGLGLALSRRLVRLMDGDLTVDSIPGEGSTFSFDLPMSPSAARIESTSIQTGNIARVLVVDDDAQSRRLAERILRSSGFEVFTAADGEEGVRLAREVRPDVIVSDILMPGKSGWDVLSSLKEDGATSDIPVVVLSILDEASKGTELGAFHCLVKPVERRTLLTAVRESIGLVGTKLNGHTVLLIDDEPDALRLVRKVLEEAGARVLTGGGGREAIGLCKSERPDVLVLDLMMPHVSGFDVVEALANDPDTADIPVIVLTAKDLSREEKDLLRGRVGKLVQKGALRPRDLVGTVERILKNGE